MQSECKKNVRGEEGKKEGRCGCARAGETWRDGEREKGQCSSLTEGDRTSDASTLRNRLSGCLFASPLQRLPCDVHEVCVRAERAGQFGHFAAIVCWCRRVYSCVHGQSSQSSIALSRHRGRRRWRCQTRLPSRPAPRVVKCSDEVRRTSKPVGRKEGEAHGHHDTTRSTKRNRVKERKEKKKEKIHAYTRREGKECASRTWTHGHTHKYNHIRSAPRHLTSVRSGRGLRGKRRQLLS